MDIPQKFMNPDGSPDLEGMTKSYQALMGAAGPQDAAAPAPELPAMQELGSDAAPVSYGDELGDQAAFLDDMIASEGNAGNDMTMLQGRRDEVLGKRSKVELIDDMKTKAFRVNVTPIGEGDLPDEAIAIEQIEELYDSKDPVVDLEEVPDGMIVPVRLSEKTFADEPLLNELKDQKNTIERIGVVTSDGKLVEAQPFFEDASDDEVSLATALLSEAFSLLEAQDADAYSMILSPSEFYKYVK